MSEIKPCPFCGGKATMQAPNMHHITCIACKECGASTKYGTPEEVAAKWNRRAQPENKPLVRCENCIHWDKSISFLLSAHACAFWSASKRNPRYTEGYEFCSFAEAKPEGSENDARRI